MVKRPKVSPPANVPATLAEACERVAAELAERPGWARVPVDRRDLVAIVAACGWNLSLEQTRDDEQLRAGAPMTAHGLDPSSLDRAQAAAMLNALVIAGFKIISPVPAVPVDPTEENDHG